MPIDLTSESVSLGTGPPTREELLVYYPPKFTWDQLKTFVNSGDLGLLKRDRALQQRYNEWSVGIKQEYGTMAINSELSFEASFAVGQTRYHLRFTLRT